MRNCLTIVLLCASLMGIAQDFVPYKSYGLQFARRFTNLNVEGGRNGYYPVNSGDMDRGFEMIFQYDYGAKKWFGVGTGVGISSLGSQIAGEKHLYYAVVPLRLQLKMGFFWFEPGLENRLFLWMKDKGNTSYVNKETIKPYHLAGSVTLRFKLFRGVSVHTGLSTGITPAVDLRDSEYSLDYGDAYFNSIAGFVGVRYMFKQPY